MFEGVPAVILNILAIAVLSFIVTSTAVSALVSLFGNRFLKVEVAARKLSLWILVSAPWTVSFLVALFFLNSFFMGDALSASPMINSPLADWHHFETRSERADWHHVDTFYWASWHGLTLLLACGLSLWVVFKKAVEYSKHRDEITKLINHSQCIDNHVWEVQSQRAYAFTSGFVNKRCFISRGMIEGVSKEELNVILLHEQAHWEKSDPLKKWLFSILTAFFVPTLAKWLRLLMTLSMEQAADNAVINQKIEPTFVASTLIKVARLNAKSTPLHQNNMAASFGADVLEQRVYFLLGKLKLKPISRWCALLFIVVMLSIALPSVDGILHIMEILFSH